MYTSTAEVVRLTDPLSGLNDVLFYTIGSANDMVQGDLLIREPGTTELSDVLRFLTVFIQNVGTVDGLFVYSDAGDADLAEVELPTTFQTNAVWVDEVGAEGRNGVTYTPTDGQPGYEPRLGPVITYNFISDTPEPSSISLFVAGIAGLLLCFRRTSR